MHPQAAQRSNHSRDHRGERKVMIGTATELEEYADTGSVDDFNDSSSEDVFRRDMHERTVM